MQEDIYIVGSGGFAKEVYGIIKRLNQFRFKGFIAYNPTSFSLKLKNETLSIIDENEFLSSIKDVNIVFGIGTPGDIKRIKNKYVDFIFPNIIDNSVILDTTNICLGIGNIITPGVILTTNIEIGSFNVFNLNCTIGHDCTIGSMNIFNPSTNISGNCKIGDLNLFGVSSVLLENKTVGNNNIFGASSLTLTNINDNGVYVGIPSKQIKNK